MRHQKVYAFHLRNPFLIALPNIREDYCERALYRAQLLEHLFKQVDSIRTLSQLPAKNMDRKLHWISMRLPKTFYIACTLLLYNSSLLSSSSSQLLRLYENITDICYFSIRNTIKYFFKINFSEKYFTPKTNQP